MIKYNTNKHSGPLDPPPPKFSNFFITPPKTFQLSLGVAGKRNTDFVRFVTILPIFAAKRPGYSKKVLRRSKGLRQKRSILPNRSDVLPVNMRCTPCAVVSTV